MHAVSHYTDLSWVRLRDLLFSFGNVSHSAIGTQDNASAAEAEAVALLHLPHGQGPNDMHRCAGLLHIGGDQSVLVLIVAYHSTAD